MIKIIEEGVLNHGLSIFDAKPNDLSSEFESMLPLSDFYDKLGGEFYNPAEIIFFVIIDRKLLCNKKQIVWLGR